MSVHEIVEKFGTITPASGEAHNVSAIVDGRVYLSKSSDGSPQIFIEGCLDSFGALPLRTTLEHSDSVVALPSNRTFQALRVSSRDRVLGERTLAHIAYELSWRLGQDPPPSNADLLQSASWLFPLLGGERIAMTQEKQLGLIGECLFLRKLVMRALSRGISVQRAVSSWLGSDQTKRDFYANGTCVEAKATSHIGRIHRIGSIDQLLHQEGDLSFSLFSVGIRSDASAPKKLTHFVRDIQALLVDSKGSSDLVALDEFRDKTESYGFHAVDSDLYDRGPGFLAPHLPPQLYSVSQLRPLTTCDFVTGQLPETVLGISYLLQVNAAALHVDEENAILDHLLGPDS